MSITLHCVFSGIVFFHRAVFCNDRACRRVFTNDYLFHLRKERSPCPALLVVHFSRFNYFILFYSKSDYTDSLKDIVLQNIIDLYNINIDVYNLKYFDISLDNIKILSVEKKVYKY